jgi:hypothetical protein
MPGLVPGIHEYLAKYQNRGWPGLRPPKHWLLAPYYKASARVGGTSPAMTGIDFCLYLAKDVARLA